MVEQTDMKAVIDAARQGQAASHLVTVGAISYFSIPGTNSVTIGTVGIEKGLAAPLRKRGITQVFDAASFSDVVASNCEDGDVTVYVNRDANAPAIVAVLNGHSLTGPGCGDHRVEILFRFTPQWLRWKEIDGNFLPQLQFAEFVENNLSDIVSPAAAEILEIAQFLSTTRSLDFRSGVRLSDGRVQLTNIETMDAKIGAGQTAIPETITLGIAPVFGLPPFQVEARFRYRIDGGKLKLGIKMLRIDDIMSAVVNDMINGTVADKTRAAVPGIILPENAMMVEGIAPDVTK